MKQKHYKIKNLKNKILYSLCVFYKKKLAFTNSKKLIKCLGHKIPHSNHRENKITKKKTFPFKDGICEEFPRLIHRPITKPKNRLRALPSVFLPDSVFPCGLGNSL